MTVWDNTNMGGITFSAKELQCSELGYIVSNDELQFALHDKIKHNESIEYFAPTAIESIEFPHLKDNSDPGPYWVTANTKQFGPIQTRLLVGADGRNSFVRNSARIPTTGYNYNQTGVIGVVEHDAANEIAWQRFLPDGPIALLPMYNNYSTVVWSTTPNMASHLKSLDNNAFAVEAARAFGTGFRDKIVPQIKGAVGKRAAFPLGLMHAQSYVRWRMAIIGDAAHVVHPLAGQGVNLGFQDVISLTSVLRDGYQAGLDLGDLTILRQYESERYWQNTAMLTGVDTMKHLFGSSFGPLGYIRNLGLTLVDNMHAIKKLLHCIAAGTFPDEIATAVSFTTQRVQESAKVAADKAAMLQKTFLRER